MADKFVSGQTTNRYDPVVSDDVKNKLDELDKNNELVKETFKAHENMINALAKQLGDVVDNAPDDLKEKADHVTLSNNDDGVAFILNQFYDKESL